MSIKSKYKSTTINNCKFISSDELYQKFLDPNSQLVKIHENIDFSFVNDLCEEIYVDSGQHAFLPEFVFRVSFIQFFKGGLSDNEVVKQCKTNLEYRYFCNLAIDDEIFDDCKLSRFRNELGVDRFKKVFDMLVLKIREKGLISKDDVQYMDSFLFLADVKIVSINALLSQSIMAVLSALNKEDTEIKKDKKRRDFELSEDQQKKRFVFLVKKAQDILTSTKDLKDCSIEAKKALAVLARIVKERADIIDENTIRKKESNEEKDKIMSVSDSDARFMGKKEHDVAPNYKSHVAMTANQFITYTDVTQATIYDGHHSSVIITDLKSREFTVPIGVGDTHYGDMEFRKAMAAQNTQIVAPYRKSQAWNSCLTEDVMIETWAYNQTNEYKIHRKIRSQIEPKQGEMKNLHGMKRAKYRGLDKVRIQNFMSAFVTNCKKIVAI